jgi:outer membrane lipoprotein carrier protein
MMKIWYSLLFTLCCTPAWAQTALEQLKTFTASTKSARGEFTQRVVKSGAPGNPATGNFAFSRPGKFRWIYIKPYEQSLIADGEKLWIYDKDLNQVTIKKLGAALGESPAAILFGSNDLEKNFNLKEAGTRDGLVWLEATPKARDATFEHVAIGFRNGAPEAMEMRDAFGQLSLLSFRNIVRNPSLDAAEFSFETPKGADVFHQ